MFALTFGGQHKTGQDTVRIRALGGASSHTDFPKNHHVSEGLFGLIVSRLEDKGVRSSFLTDFCEWGQTLISDYRLTFMAVPC